MKAALAITALLLLQGSFDQAREVDPSPQRFRFQRQLQLPAAARGQACAVADAAIFAHADSAQSAGRLNALRIYSNGREVPFTLSESGEAGQQEEPARIMNLGTQGGAIVFDLAMPARAYTEVLLDLNATDFYATAKVWGESSPAAPRTELGQFVLFDLHSRGLARSTTLSLQEATFSFLHVELKATPAPGGDAERLGAAMVRGASVPPSREAQTLYTTIAETAAITTRGHESIANLNVPARVPIERVRFLLDDAFTNNFSREVKITAHSAEASDSDGDEEVSGQIERVRLPAPGPDQAIDSEQLSIEAMLASDLRSDAKVNVVIENGDDAPLPLRAVQLQMRERNICFDADPGASYVLRYGDTAPVRAPVYDYARLFHADPHAVAAILGPETPNPDFRPEIPHTSYSERHPELLWVALLLMVAVLGTVALHNARRVVHNK